MYRKKQQVKKCQEDSRDSQNQSKSKSAMKNINSKSNIQEQIKNNKRQKKNNKNIKKIQEELSQTEIQVKKDYNENQLYKKTEKIEKIEINIKEKQITKNQIKKFQENQQQTKGQFQQKLEKPKKKQQNQSEEDQQDQKNIIQSSSQKKLDKKTRLQARNEQVSRKAHEIIQQINNAYQKDIKHYKNNQPAAQKLKWMMNESRRLKDVQVSKQFLKLGGMLLFNKWLLPNQQTGQDTSLTVKIKVFQLIYDLNPTTNDIDQGQSLGKLIKKYKRSRFDSLQKLSQRILMKWKNIKAIKQQGGFKE